MSSPFGALIEIESTSSKPVRPELNRVPTAPEKALPKNYHSVALPQAPDAIELDSLEWGTKLNGPPKSGNATPSGAQTPRDLEMSRPASPTSGEQDGVDVM